MEGAFGGRRVCVREGGTLPIAICPPASSIGADPWGLGLTGRQLAFAKEEEEFDNYTAASP